MPKLHNCQGSVSGLLEEVAGLVRRVEGLDEKLRPPSWLADVGWAGG